MIYSKPIVSHHSLYPSLWFPCHCCPNQLPPSLRVWKPPSHFLLDEAGVEGSEVGAVLLAEVCWCSSPLTEFHTEQELCLLKHITVFHWDQVCHVVGKSLSPKFAMQPSRRLKTHSLYITVLSEVVFSATKNAFVNGSLRNLLTFDFLPEAWADNEPNEQRCDEGTAQGNAQCTPPRHSVKAQHCAHTRHERELRLR